MNKTYASRMLGFKHDLCTKSDDGYLYLGNEYYAIRIFGADIPENFKECGTESLSLYSDAFKKFEDEVESNLKIPAIADIEAACKGYRSGDPVKYDFRDINKDKEFAPLVNQMYLRNTLVMFSKKEEILGGTMGGSNDPVFLWQDGGNIEAFIFPIKRR